MNHGLIIAHESSCVWERLQSWPQLKPFWEQLRAETGNRSFFLTPEWVEVWLETFAPPLTPDFLAFYAGPELAGACIVVRRRRRLGPSRLDIAYLNTAGEDEAASVCVEYNDLLARPGRERMVAAALRGYLGEQGCDEVRLSGFTGGPALEALRAVYADSQWQERTDPCYFVDLETVRNAQKPFVETLRQPTRKHLKQYFRYCGELGPLSVETPGAVGDALADFARMQVLHQERWTARGERGAFSDTRFTLFHERLIRRLFDAGRIRLFRVSAGETVLGILYAFVHEGTVLFYQSGFNYSAPSRISPGMVASAAAVQHAADAGLAEFDFLAGDAQYKRALSAAHRELRWIAIRLPGWKRTVLDAARRGKRMAAAMRRKLTGRSGRNAGPGDGN